MNSIASFGEMIADKGRTAPYVAALRDAVPRTGVLLMLGRKRVFLPC